MFINACHLLSVLPSLSQFGWGRLSLVAISFYALSLLFWAMPLVGIYPGRASKSNVQNIAKFGNYPGDFRLQSGDREKRFKIGSLLDYLGEMTALQKSVKCGDFAEPY